MDASDVGDVLVLRALGLGDTLTAVPALRALRRALPGARIHLAAPDHLGRFLERRGVVDAVVPLDGLDAPLQPAAASIGANLRSRGIGVNLHGRGPQSHTVLRHQQPTRVVAFASSAANHDGPSWRDDEHEVDRWVRLVTTEIGGHAGPGDLRLPAPAARGDHVVIHPGAASPARRWPVERWVVVARAFSAAGRVVHVTGSAAEAPLGAALTDAVTGAVDRCGRDDLDSLAAVVGTAAVVCCGDTGVAHLATAFGTPSVVLFGPLSPQLWGPRTDEAIHRVLWTGSAASLRPGDPHGDRPDPRLLTIGSQAVLLAADEAMTAAG
ncbi:MAG: glycosyltransferase family 9 protein [Dermatophilaceae bacterium]